MYIPRYFCIEELVPPEIQGVPFVPQKNEAERQRLFMLFDIVALQTLDALRQRFGAVTVNNWHVGGARKLSGWRPFDCPVGARYSQHKWGRAFDCLFHHATPEDVRADIFAHPEREEYRHIRRIEAFEGMNWFHFDTGNHERERAGIAVIGAS